MSQLLVLSRTVLRQLLLIYVLKVNRICIEMGMPVPQCANDCNHLPNCKLQD